MLEETLGEIIASLDFVAAVKVTASDRFKKVRGLGSKSRIGRKFGLEMR